MYNFILKYIIYRFVFELPGFLKHMKCFSGGRKYMKKCTLREFFWKSKLAFFELADGTIFKILPRFFGFLLFGGRKTPPNSAELVLKKSCPEDPETFFKKIK